jgi:hypothetical protein
MVQVIRRTAGVALLLAAGALAAARAGEAFPSMRALWDQPVAAPAHAEPDLAAADPT